MAKLNAKIGKMKKSKFGRTDSRFEIYSNRFKLGLLDFLFDPFSLAITILKKSFLRAALQHLSTKKHKF
jgi:hypothetical protein